MRTENYSKELQRIIEEKTAELEKTKNYLESILRYSSDMIITTDLSGRIVTFNEGAERILGYKKEDVLGTFMVDYYLDKEDRERLLSTIESGEMVTNYETQLVRKDGKIIDISLSLSLLRDEREKVIGTVGISKDITELKKAQRDLKEYSQHLESMVEKRTLELEENKSHLEAMLGGIADGVVFADQDNRITFINEAAEEIFGVKREEWVGRDFKDAHSAESHEKALKLIQDMREGKIKSYSSEIKSGKKYIYAHFSPIMHVSEYLGVIFIARDITEIKRLQSELMNSEKLALIGKMSSSIAHELRNPLVPIGGFARLLYKKLEQEATLRKYADIIIKEIDRMEILLHDILYFTKEIKPELQSVNLNEIINDLLYFYNDTFTDKNIELNVHLSPDISLIPLDRLKIRQALINIFSNAVDAMTDGGILRVESIEKEKDGKHYIVVTVRDSGPGIPEDVKKKIFEPFYTTKVHGLGLGLTLTKNVVEAHGGEIEIESEVGKGTTFIISLPVSSL